MRNASFYATEQQILDQTKDVTRRLGWINLKPGELLQPIYKGQGLKKGEKVRKLGCPIRVLSVRREPLNAITAADVIREGFSRMSPEDFIRKFLEINNCHFDEIITRIEFEYTEPKS